MTKTLTGKKNIIEKNSECMIHEVTTTASGFTFVITTDCSRAAASAAAALQYSKKTVNYPYRGAILVAFNCL